MKLLLVLSFVALCYVSTCIARDMMVGNIYNGRLIWQQKVEYMAIPFKKRVKEAFFSDPSLQIIRGIIVKETYPTEASVNVTAGGVGFSYVNLRFKSERGSGLYYRVEIYI